MPHGSCLTLELSTRVTDSGTVVVATVIEHGRQDRIATIPVEEARPRFPEGSRAARIVALDVLEHVIDEESWIGTLAGLLEPGGELTVRAPLEGVMTWLDALNLVRYVQDITGWGKQPQETAMKGWHRHYRQRDLEGMLREAGLTVTDVQRSGSPHLELVQLGTLLWGNLTRRTRRVERQAKRNRERDEVSTDLPRLGPLSTKITVRAVKVG